MSRKSQNEARIEQVLAEADSLLVRVRSEMERDAEMLRSSATEIVAIERAVEKGGMAARETVARCVEEMRQKDEREIEQALARFSEPAPAVRPSRRFRAMV